MSEVQLSQVIHAERYAHPGEKSWADTSRRVASFIAQGELQENQSLYTDLFYDLISNYKFIPGGRILANAGRPRGQLLNCFVINLEDSRESIGQMIKEYLIISGTGGGVGISFSKLRPKGTNILTNGGTSSGSVSFMDIVDATASTIKTGGGRRAATMISLSAYHPDLETFLSHKLDLKNLTNANVSVEVDSRFLDAVRNKTSWDLVWGGKVVKTVDARKIWNKLVENAWKSGEPGVLNMGLARKMSNAYYYADLVTTNPCVVEGTLVNTPFGYKKVETLVEGDIISTVLGSEPIKTVEVNHNCLTYEVVFSDGGVQYVTAAHRYHAIKKDSSSKKITDYRLDELVVGDTVRIEPTPLKSEGTDADYIFGLKQGILLGDGCYTEASLQLHDTVKISCNQDEREYNSNLKDLFGPSNFSKDDLSSDSKSMSLVHKRGASLVNALALTPGYSYDKTFPIESVLSAQHAMGVLDGILATDGNVNLRTNHPQIRWMTTSVNLAQTVRRLLLMVGCHGNISSSFDSSGTIKGRKIIRKHSKYTVTVCGASAGVFAKNSHLDRLHPQKGERLKQVLKSWVTSGNWWRARIVSVKPYKKSTVYDLFCEKSDTWITDGYVQRGCGEQFLPAYSSCCLGSINLSSYVRGEENFSWEEFKVDIKTSIRFLDNVLTVNEYPLENIKQMSSNERRIGLGVMGLHTAMLQLGYKYSSSKGLEFVEKIYECLRNASYLGSVDLAVEKGSFPYFKPDLYLNSGFTKTLPTKIRNLIRDKGIRNVCVNTQAPTGCQVKDTMVVSTAGIFRLDELLDVNGPSWQDLGLSILQEDKSSLATKSFMNGLAKTKRIVLSSGIVLEATFNHRYRVINSSGDYLWKRVDELVVGDSLAVRIGGYEKTSEASLHTVIKSHFKHKTLKLPTSMSPSLAWLLGLYYADGSTHTKGIRFSLGGDQVVLANKVAKTVKKLFGYKVSIKKDPRENCLNVYFNSQQLLQYLTQNGLIKQKASLVSIPLPIRLSSKNSLQAFIAGYWDGDGSKNSTDGISYIDTTSFEMAQQLAICKRALGQNVVIQTQTKRTGYGTKPIYRVKDRKTGSIDFIAASSKPWGYMKKELRSKQVYCNSISENLTFDSVKELTVSSSFTFDIEVPENNTYVANSIISHNTTSMVANVSSGIEPIFAPLYDRRFRSEEAGAVDGFKVERVVDPLLKQFVDEGRAVGHFEGAYDVSVDTHLAVQEIAQRYVDSSISKTINIPEDYPQEKLSDIWLEYADMLKGTTLYRSGSRGQEPLTPIQSSISSLKKLVKDKDSDIGVGDMIDTSCPNGVCAL